MAIRLLDTEHLTALAFGAGDALVTAKATRTGPGGIPWSVLYEGAGLLAGFFGGKVGIPAGARDSLTISALTLASARLTRSALAGKLMAGPKAWGGEDRVGGDYSYPDPGMGGGAPVGALSPGAKVRLLQGNRVGGGFSIGGLPVPFAESAGVAG